MADATNPESSFALGRAFGEIHARLSAHDEKFLSLTNSVERISKAAEDLTLAVHTLGTEAKNRDQANMSAWKARDDTVEATAKALKEAKDTQEATSRAESTKIEKFWTPWTRLFGLAAATATVVYTLYIIFMRAK